MSGDPARRSPGAGARASGGVVSSQNLAGAASAASAPLREGRATRTEWTPAMDATLAAMRAAGHSATAISRVLGVTASAVSGRALRLCLPMMPNGRQGANAAPEPPSPARVWTRQDEAMLLGLHAECDGDWRKIAPKLRRDIQDCRVRHRRLMMLKPAKVGVERKCLFCQKVKMIPQPMRICDGCRDTEEWRNASAWQ
jgi:hypothetical protein